MATTTLRQTSFAAGELSPLLYGRTDLEAFAHGARTLRNYLVTPQGVAVSRPGTFAVTACKTKDVVLVPFIFSDDVAYVLELGEYYLRIHSHTTGYTGTELAAPWRAADLPFLQWAQVGSVLTLTHSAYRPTELRAPVPGVSVSWVLADARFVPPGNAPSDVQSMVPVFRDMGGNYRLMPLPIASVSSFVGDAQRPPREWRWKVSTLMRHNVTGEEVETLPISVIEYFDGTTRASVALLPDNNLIVLYPDRAVTLRHPTFGPLVGSPFGYSNWQPVGSVYYRGRGSLFGFIGTTRYAQDFVDVGGEPDYARPPLRGDSPFTPGTDFPAAVAFFQKRRVFGGAPNRPSTLWASAVDEWANHDRPFPPFIPESAALEISLAARTRESVRSLVPHRRCLVFTDAGVWSLGGGDTALTPASIEWRMEDGVGATRLQPLVVDGAVLYVRAKGRGVRALSLDTSGAYVAQDITWQAEHLFRGYSSEVVSWCFQRDPWATIWAARADGKLLSCTRTGQAMWAWAQHETAGGQVRSLACVPAARSDIVFAAVTRGDSTYLERFLVRDRPVGSPISTESGEADYAVDSFVAFTCARAAAYTATGLARFEAQDVWAVAPGNAPQGPLRVTAGQVVLAPFEAANRSDGQVQVAVGLAFTADLELLDAVGAGRLQQKTVVSVGFEVDNAQDLQIGEDFAHLVPWLSRTVQDNYEFPSAASVLAVVLARGSWRRTGRAVLRQAKPIPVSVLGITRLLDTGGA